MQTYPSRWDRFRLRLRRRRSRAQLGKDVLVLLVIQVGLNAAWASYQAGAVSWRFAIGTVTALLTIFLLS